MEKNFIKKTFKFDFCIVLLNSFSFIYIIIITFSLPTQYMELIFLVAGGGVEPPTPGL